MLILILIGPQNSYKLISNKLLLIKLLKRRIITVTKKLPQFISNVVKY